MVVVEFLEAGVIPVGPSLTQGRRDGGHGELVAKLDCGAENGDGATPCRPMGRDGELRVNRNL